MAASLSRGAHPTRPHHYSRPLKPLKNLYRVIPLLCLLGCGATAASPANTAAPATIAPVAPQVSKVATAPPVAAAPKPTRKPLPNDGTLLTHDEIQTIVRHHFNDMVHCYEDALAHNPNTPGGLVNIVLVIAGNGSVLSADPQPLPKRPKPNSAKILTDPQVRSCIARAFQRIQFPPTNRGMMNMIYPVELSVE